MKQVYKCDFCDECFTNKTEAIAHEDKCGRNPKNKINDRTVFRLAMIFDSLPAIIACALGFLTIVMGVGIIITNMTADSKAAEYEVRYQALTYQLENEMYEKDSGCGKKQLMTQIMEYNAEIAAGRAGQGNIWYGIFVPDIYNDLALIEMGNE